MEGGPGCRAGTPVEASLPDHSPRLEGVTLLPDALRDTAGLGAAAASARSGIEMPECSADTLWQT